MGSLVVYMLKIISKSSIFIINVFIFIWHSSNWFYNLYSYLFFIYNFFIEPKYLLVRLFFLMLLHLLSTTPCFQFFSLLFQIWLISFCLSCGVYFFDPISFLFLDLLIYCSISTVLSDLISVCQLIYLFSYHISLSFTSPFALTWSNLISFTLTYSPSL